LGLRFEGGEERLLGLKPELDLATSGTPVLFPNLIGSGGDDIVSGRRVFAGFLHGRIPFKTWDYGAGGAMGAGALEGELVAEGELILTPPPWWSSTSRDLPVSGEAGLAGVMRTCPPFLSRPL